ncbi:MAG: hypothetical protein JO358_14090, partial [Alphaproteobacteria bacterium]|nr:hypothetical protein [Alphaproteobacteria bacterium]
MPIPAVPLDPREREEALALLRWYIDMGADEAIGAEPANRLAPLPTAVARAAPAAAPVIEPPAPRSAAIRSVAASPPTALAASMAEAAQSARRLAAGAESVAALAALIAG